MNRFIRFQYNEKILTSIDDYKSDEVLSLELALKPVLSHVDQLAYYIEKAKRFRHYPSEHDLTEDESAAVYIYTDDWGDQSINRILNDALQSEDRTIVTPWLGFLNLFNAALEKLPTVKNTIWRGLTTDIAEKFNKDEELICWGVTSCSTSADIIKSFLSSNSVLCSIEPLNGKNIHGYTPFVNDHEVLLLSGTRLRVKSKGSNNREYKSIICLEEISEVDDEQDISALEDNDYLKMKSITVTKRMNNDSLSNDGKLNVNDLLAVVTFFNGDRYEVTYRNGKKQDYGKYYRVDEEKFEGQNADDKANGEGICVFSNGDRFIGTFEHGTRHGHGIFLNNVNGSIQAGDWVNDESTNQSLKIMSNGGHYDWRDARDENRWYGAYFDDNGNKYIGNVVDGKVYGLGIRIFSDGSRYEGNFENDKKHGYGIYYYSDRDKYMGQWANDEINGEGKLTWTSGTCYKGKFINGKRHGFGKLTFGNQKIQEGNWREDEYVG